MTSVSTQGDETAGADPTRDGDRASATADSGERPVRGRDGRDARATATSDDPAHGGADESAADRRATVRTRLIESTVVATITGAFVVLGGSAEVAPRLSLPIALTGVLWLFVRTLSPLQHRGGGEARTTDEKTVPRIESETEPPAVTGLTEDPDPHPDETPVSTDRRLKLEVADHGGRMMQKELVESVDLSESAVSRRLSRLESEDDEVGRVCLGRENMVYLEGHRPEGADSPFAGEAKGEGENLG